jgi:predicted nucleotidyltransferase
MTIREHFRRNEPALCKFCAALERVYGERLERVVLFGSRARGDAVPESDYDVAVFLADMPDRWKEFDRLLALRLAFMDEVDADLPVLPFAAADYDRRTGLMHAIRTEGVPL